MNKRISLLALTILATGLAAVLLAAATFGVRWKQTVASRSAAAFREAQRKGDAVGKGAHGHSALSPGPKAQPAHGEHGGPEVKKSEQAHQKSSNMAGHDMAGQPIPTSSSADAHAGHAMPAQAGLGSPAGQEGQPQRPAPHDQEGTSASSPAMAAQPPQASPGQPAGTLQPDPLDRPAETSVVDARRSAEMAGKMWGGHGLQHGMTSYRQLDAGRGSVMPGREGGSVAPASPTSPDHRGMQHGSPPRGPAVKKPTPPSRPTPSAPPPEPTDPPHHSVSPDPGAQEDGELR